MRPVNIDGLGHYLISETGEVFATIEEGRWRRKLPEPVKRKASKRRDGYYYISLSGTNIKKAAPIHHLVLLTYVGPRPSPKHICRHLDGNKENNHYSNLAWGTHKENSQDMVRHGRSARGTKNPLSKFSLDQIQLVRSYSGSGLTYKQISALTGVSPTHVGVIFRRGCGGWSWVDGAENVRPNSKVKAHLKELAAQAIAMKNDGMKIGDIAKLLGRSPCTISLYINRPETRRWGNAR